MPDQAVSTEVASPGVISSLSLQPTSVASVAPPVSSIYTEQFLQAIETSPDSCLPDHSVDDIGVYIYDLKNQQELVSINADTPFQVASAFKAPVLVYFLSSCRQYWDVKDAAWTTYFLDQDAVENIEWYTSEPYKQKVAAYLSDVNHWDHIETFFVENRVRENDVVDGRLDKRYFILGQVFSMVARSSNPAAGNVLRFVYDNCLEPPPAIAEACGGSNPITAFNRWLTDFAALPNATEDSHRGLYEWDIILETNRNGKIVETIMPTHGFKDTCANQFATLNCSSDRQSQVVNAMTARDFFRFYRTLFELPDERVRQTALDLLKIDLNGPSRGDLKHLASVMEAEAASKNGQAFYSYGPIIADAGIFDYRGHPFVIVTLSFDAESAIHTLYGEYNPSGELISDPGLIQNLLEQYSGQ